MGYLNNIGLKESNKRALIASSPEEYVEFVVRLGANDTSREESEVDYLRSCLAEDVFRSACNTAIIVF